MEEGFQVSWRQKPKHQSRQLTHGRGSAQGTSDPMPSVKKGGRLLSRMLCSLCWLDRPTEGFKEDIPYLSGSVSLSQRNSVQQTHPYT